MTFSVEREQLRREMRARRRALSDDELRRAASRFARVADHFRLLRPGRHIAAYFRHGHEADLTRLIASARRRGCVIYLPVITDYRRNRMQFHRYHIGATLTPNRYGIPEPKPGGEVAPVRRLDLVFAPLVAFDHRGARLGSGAGYYDRSLQHLRAGRRWRRPRLIGVGYEFQRVEQLGQAPWDVPLDAVLTDKHLYLTHPSAGDAP